MSCPHAGASPVYYEPLGEKRMRCDACGEYLHIAQWRRIRTGSPASLEEWREMFLDHTEGLRKEPPGIDLLNEDDRDAAVAWVASYEAAKGVNPYAQRGGMGGQLRGRQGSEPLRPATLRRGTTGHEGPAPPPRSHRPRQPP